MTGTVDRPARTEADQGLVWQRFSVPFEFPVAFTEGVFDPESTLLADVLALREPDKRHRCLVFIDEGLLGPIPDLIARIEAYAERHRDRMELVARPQAVAGGERIKTELTHLEHLQGKNFRHVCNLIGMDHRPRLA